MARVRTAATIVGMALLPLTLQAQAPFTIARINPEDSNEAVRQVRLLDAYVSQGSWSEAADLLAQMVEAYPHQVIPVETSRPLRFVSIRNYCHARIASLPAEAIGIYRQRVDSQANAIWREYERTGDEELLRRIADEFFCSSVGDDAVEELGDRAMSEGRLDEAIAWWSKLLPSKPTAANENVENGPATEHRPLRYPEPESDVARVLAKWTIAQRIAGDPISAAKGEQWLRDDYAESSGELAGHSGRYFEIVAAVTRDTAINAPPSPRSDWPTFAGSFARTHIAPNPIRIGAIQHRWGLHPPAVNHESETAFGDLDHRFVQPFARLTRRPQPDGLVCHPVTSGPYVFVSDGTRLLQFHVDQEEPVFAFNFDLDKSGATAGGALARQTLSVSGNYLFARTGTLTMMAQPPFPGRGISTASRLFCFDHAHRKLLWWKSADSLGIAPPVVFEGAPVVAGNKVLIGLTRADAMTTSYVVCFDAESDSGDVLWKRLVCEATNDLEFAPGPDQNLLTLADQTVFCCTNLGAVAALDVPNAKLKWIAEYEVDSSSPGRNMTPDVNPCVYEHGRLFVAPAGSSSIFCYDAESGELLWRCRAPATQILGVAKGLLIVAGPRLLAIDVRTGQVAWSFPENMPGTAGRGLLAGDFVYWPTASEIHVLDQKTGRRTETAISLLEGLRLKPGNLVPGDGYTLLAQNRQLVVLRPNRWLKEESLKLVEANPESAEAHLQLAQAAAADDDFSLAIPHFEQAIRLADAGHFVEGQSFAQAARSKLFGAQLAAASARVRFADANEGSVRSGALAEAERMYRQAAHEAPGIQERFRALQQCADMFADAKQPAESLTVLHEILADKTVRESLVDAGPGRRRLASDLVSAAISSLVQTHGADIYAPWDAALRAEIESAADSSTILEAVAKRPLAESATDVLMSLSETLQREGRTSLARHVSRVARRYESVHLNRPVDPLGKSSPFDWFERGDSVRSSDGEQAATLPVDEESNAASRVVTTWINVIPNSRWLVDTRFATDWNCLLEVSGRVIAGRSGDADDPLWQTELDQEVRWSSQSPAGLILGTDDQLVVLDPSDGTVRWSAWLDPDFPLEEWIGSGEEDRAIRHLVAPLTDKSHLLPHYTLGDEAAHIVTTAGRVVQVDLDLRRLRWELDPLVLQQDASSTEQMQQHVQAIDSILLAWSNRRVFAIDPVTAEVLWSLPVLHDATGIPAVASGGRAIIVTGRDRIVAVDPRKGEIAWTKSTGWPSWGAPTLHSGDDGALLAILDGYALCRIDVDRGDTLWEVAVTRSPRPGLGASAILHDGRIYLATNEGLDCRDMADGKRLWRSETQGLTAVVLDRAASGSGRIVGLQRDTGLPRLKAWNLHQGTLLCDAIVEPADVEVRLLSIGGEPMILGVK